MPVTIPNLTNEAYALLAGDSVNRSLTLKMDLMCYDCSKINHVGATETRIIRGLVLLVAGIHATLGWVQYIARGLYKGLAGMSIGVDKVGVSR